jgi:S-adenosylmethionine synthetase
MYTSEFVSPMHPDKICDRISASILDECLKQDPNSRVAVETLGGHKKIVVMGEITTKANVDFKELIQKEINDSSFEILVNITQQSPSIAQGVDIGGAGDQGIMIGYACSDSKNLMPLEYELARSLCKFIFHKYPFDGKTQITIDESKNITDIVASFQNVSKDILKALILSWLLDQKIDSQNINF